MADIPSPSPQNMDGFWLIAILSLVFFAWVSQGGPSAFESERVGTSTVQTTVSENKKNTVTSNSRTNTVIQASTSAQVSPYNKKIKISNRGNSASERWADNEYITLQNVSNQSITITGWYLQNGRDQRGYIDNLNNLTKGVSDTAVIPKGVRTLLVSTNNSVEQIILSPRDKAIVTSGKMTKKASFLGLSFKVNKCSGYLNEYPGYALQPQISKQCPRPSAESGLDLLEDSCYNFVKKKLQVCHTPVYREEMQKSGELRQYLDSTYGLSRVCREYVQQHFNYQWCTLTYMKDSDFYKGEWRIYLNRQAQLWDSGRERIALYDAQGKLVDELKY